MSRSRARRATSRRARQQRLEAGYINESEALPHLSIRPTHIDHFGYRYELPVKSKIVLNQVYEVTCFRPSSMQRSLRCDGCARSHQRRPQCFATHGNETLAIIPAGNQNLQPVESLTELVTFHSLTHKREGQYKGYIEEIIGFHRNYKGGRVKVRFQSFG